MQPTLYYTHDPMCSWCWGYRPVQMQIAQALQSQLNIVDLLGGLAPDSDEPMPQALRQTIEHHWHKVNALLGTQFNHDFWKKNTPYRSTYPACRAVLAARKQGCNEMVLAIQQAYYLRALNPSEDDTLLQLADELGLDFDQFQTDFYSDTINQELAKEIAQARGLGIKSYPSWVLQNGDQHVEILLDYQSAHATLADISEKLQDLNS